MIGSSESCQYETSVVYHTRTRTRSVAGTPNGADDHPTRTGTCMSTTTAAIMRAQKRSGILLTALLQPPYNRAHYVGIIIGPDALSGIGRQERPISRLRERTEILILARHRGDGRDPLLLARIFLNVAAVIEARNRAVCMGDAGDAAPKLEMIVRHVERYDAVWLELAQIDRHRLLGEEVYRYCSADESIDKDQVVTGIGRVRDRQPRVAFHDGNVRPALRDEVEQCGIACDPDDVGIEFVIDDTVLGPRLAGETSGAQSNHRIADRSANLG